MLLTQRKLDLEMVNENKKQIGPTPTFEIVGGSRPISDASPK